MVQPDGHIIVGGGFTSFGATGRNRIARLNGEGTVDMAFDPGTGLDGPVSCVGSLPFGRILIGGSFTIDNGTPAGAVARLAANGSVEFGAEGDCRAAGPVQSVVPLADGKWLVAGRFGWANGVRCDGVVRIFGDGSLDMNFVPNSGFNGGVTCAGVQVDGKALVAGYGGTGSTIRRYNTDGSLDATFDVGAGFNQAVNCLLVQTDGKIVVGGAFTTYNGHACNRILRLHGDGSLDTSFNPGVGFDGSVSSVALQPDGKIVAGGWFVNYRGTMRGFIARLNSDASLDTTFSPGSGFNDAVSGVVVQSDGAIVACGWFSVFNNLPCQMLARLKGDGSLDAGFQVFDLARINDFVKPTIQYTDDGRLLVTGVFASRGAVAQSSIAMLVGAAPESFAGWLARWPVPANRRGVLDAPAGDGVANLTKFALGVPPLDGAALHLPTISVASAAGQAPNIALVFTKNRRAEGVRYSLVVSENLVTWTEVPNVTEVLGLVDDGAQLVRMREAVPPHASRRFAKLKVTLAEP